MSSGSHLRSVFVRGGGVGGVAFWSMDFTSLGEKPSEIVKCVCVHAVARGKWSSLIMNALIRYSREEKDKPLY